MPHPLRFLPKATRLRTAVAILQLALSAIGPALQSCVSKPGRRAVLGFLVSLNGLGLSITPMLTAVGAGGLTVALALQEPLANFFAGLFITRAGQIRVDDYVKLDSG